MTIWSFDMDEIEQVAREMCRERGLDPDKRMQEFGRTSWAYPQWEDFRFMAIHRIKQKIPRR